MPRYKFRNYNILLLDLPKQFIIDNQNVDQDSLSW